MKVKGPGLPNQKNLGSQTMFQGAGPSLPAMPHHMSKSEMCIDNNTSQSPLTLVDIIFFIDMNESHNKTANRCLFLSH